jgi:hypothetical protein
MTPPIQDSVNGGAIEWSGAEFHAVVIDVHR